MKLLVTGTSGQLAQSLLELGLARGVDIVAMRRPQLDLTIPSTIAIALADARPDIVVNAAAYTASTRPRASRSWPVASMRRGLEKLLRNASGSGFRSCTCRPTTCSTAPRPRHTWKAMRPGRSTPMDAPSSRARKRWRGLPAARDPADVVGVQPVRHEFRAYDVAAGAGRTRSCGVVDDQLGCPTSALDLADAILGSPRRSKSQRADAPDVGHLSCGGQRRDDVVRVRARDLRGGRVEGVAAPKVEGIATADYPTPARRPANSRLDCGKLARTFGVHAAATGARRAARASSGWYVRKRLRRPIRSLTAHHGGCGVYQSAVKSMKARTLADR